MSNLFKGAYAGLIIAGIPNAQFLKDLCKWNYIIRTETPGYMCVKLLSKKEENKNMAMSKDRVRFFLHHRYFQEGHHTSVNGMRGDVCRDILSRAFGISKTAGAALMQRHRNGFYIICRPSQFARFIVFRHEDGECINGIKDLEPEIIREEPDCFTHISEVTGVNRHDVIKVINVFGYSGNDYRPRDTRLAHEIDVSKNPAQHEC